MRSMEAVAYPLVSDIVLAALAGYWLNAILTETSLLVDVLNRVFGLNLAEFSDIPEWLDAAGYPRVAHGVRCTPCRITWCSLFVCLFSYLAITAVLPVAGLVLVLVFMTNRGE